MDALALQQHFLWFLERSIHGDGQRIYFDNAATSQKPMQVINAELDFYNKHNATVHRGLYDAAESATTLYEQVRTKVATFINAAHAEEIIFTSGATEGINAFAYMWQAQINPGDEIIITQAEHHANLLPWQRLAKQRGAVLKFFPLDCNDFCIAQDALNLITSKTKLLAIAHESNVLGPMWRENQLEQLIKKAHEVGAKVLLDGAASIAHQKIDVQALNIDVMVASGHKMLGPTGVGFLYIKKELHDACEPYRLGGSMVYSVAYDGATWAKAPQKFEAGTPPIAQVIGLGAAIDFYNQFIPIEQLKKHEAHLCKVLIEGLLHIKGVRILGNIKKLTTQGHLVTFVVEHVHAHDLAAYLSSRNVMVRAGHHCAQPLATLLGVQSSLRVSFFGYNFEQEVLLFLEILRQGITELRS